MSRGMIVTREEDWPLRHPFSLIYILTPGYSFTSGAPLRIPESWSDSSDDSFLLILIGWSSSRVYYFYLSFTRTDLRVSSLTHPVSCHVTFSGYIVSIITCLYLSFLLSRNPTLLDLCVSADKLGCLKSFYLRGTLSWLDNSPMSVPRPPSPRSSLYGPRRLSK